jgi:DNA polymerase-3 subunit epsilon
MEFVAIDVETANADMSSICQIGLVYFKEGVLCEEWKSYVDPEDFFDGMNISIHGIDEFTVQGAPRLPEIVNILYKFLDYQITVCHTHFDRVCRGYGLHNICETLGYKFKHHDALEDAKAAGHIMLTAMQESSLDLKGWLKRVNQPISRRKSQAISSRKSQAIKLECDANPEGCLYGEVIVFTGALGLNREEAADMAAKIGCQVESGVNKKTTILVVGNQDIKKLAGHEKSSKHRKAEALILTGQKIRIIGENDFKELINLGK